MPRNVAFAIPSYKRCGRVSTVDMLEKYGMKKSDIYIGVQTLVDYDSYSRHYGNRANVIYGESTNCAGNRNNLLNHLKGKYDYVLMMDDDVSSITILEPERRPGMKSRYRQVGIRLDGSSKSSRMFETIIERHIDLLEKGAQLVSAYGGTRLNLINKKRIKITNGMARGTWMFMKPDKLRFNDNMACCDDNELSARIIANGGMSLVDESVSANTNAMTSTIEPDDVESAGGCAEVYTSADNAIRITQEEFILRPYKGLVKGKWNAGGNNGKRYYTITLNK